MNIFFVINKLSKFSKLVKYMILLMQKTIAVNDYKTFKIKRNINQFYRSHTICYSNLRQTPVERPLVTPRCSSLLLFSVSLITLFVSIITFPLFEMSFIFWFFSFEWQFWQRGANRSAKGKWYRCCVWGLNGVWFRNDKDDLAFSWY